MNIEFYRKRAGLTQAELAEKLNVDQSAVSHWEKGDWPPRRRLLPILAQALDVTVEELTTEEAQA